MEVKCTKCYEKFHRCKKCKLVGCATSECTFQNAVYKGGGWRSFGGLRCKQCGSKDLVTDVIAE